MCAKRLSTPASLTHLTRLVTSPWTTQHTGLMGIVHPHVCECPCLAAARLLNVIAVCQVLQPLQLWPAAGRGSSMPAIRTLSLTSHAPCIQIRLRLGPLHLMTGKLDWALLKGLTPITWRMGNLDFAASDHRSLVVEAE